MDNIRPVSFYVLGVHGRTSRRIDAIAGYKMIPELIRLNKFYKIETGTYYSITIFLYTTFYKRELLNYLYDKGLIDHLYRSFDRFNSRNSITGDKYNDYSMTTIENQTILEQEEQEINRTIYL